VVFPAAISGITASIVLAVARAIGETMAVTMAAGTAQYVNFNPFAGALTATSAIANTAANDIAHSGPAYSSLFMVGLVLFLLTLIMNMVAQRFVKRFREVE
jgi:phosphate transport system permease protein